MPKLTIEEINQHYTIKKTGQHHSKILSLVLSIPHFQHPSVAGDTFFEGEVLG